MPLKNDRIQHLVQECKGTFLEKELFTLLADWVDDTTFNKFYLHVTSTYGILMDINDPDFVLDGDRDE